MKQIIMITILMFTLLISGSVAQTTAYERDFELARRFILLQKYEEAIEVLEELRVQNPGDIRVIEQLKSAYFALKEYDKMIDILNTQLASSPKNIALWIELGGTYLNLGKVDDATDAFDAAIDIDSRSAATYNSIAMRYQQWGYITEAIEFLEKAKKEVSQKGAFSIELGRLYEINREFKKAIDEYIEYLTLFPDRVGEVRHRITTMGKDMEQLVEIEKVLKNSMKGGPMDKMLYPLLGQIQVRKGDYAAALESYREAEKFEKRFKYIPNFTQDALKAKEYKIALEAADLIIEEGEPYLKIEAKFIKGASLRGLERYEEAINIYNEITKTCPPMVCAQAYLEIGKIHFYDYENAEEGIKYFKMVVEEHTNNPHMEDGVKEYVNALYKMEQIEEAHSFLIDLVSSHTYENDLVLFKLAEVYFLIDDFTKAGEYFSKLITNYPQSFYVNDAINYLLLTEDEKNEHFGEVTEIIYLYQIGKYEDCSQKLQALLDQQLNFKIDDYLIWLAGNVAFELGQYNDALKYLDQLQTKFQESYFAPMAIELKGDIYLEKGEYSKAADAYNTILMEFPEAVNINSIRNKIRVIETRI